MVFSRLARTCGQSYQLEKPSIKLAQKSRRSEEPSQRATFNIRIMAVQKIAKR